MTQQIQRMLGVFAYSGRYSQREAEEETQPLIIHNLANPQVQVHGFSGCTPYGAIYLCWGFGISLARICRHGVGTLLAQTGDIALTTPK